MCLKKIMRMFERGMRQAYITELYSQGIISREEYLRLMEEAERGKQGEA